MENICCTCLSMEGELVSLFSDTSCTANLSEKIMNISTIVIDKCNDFPHMICRKCILLVEAFVCFKKQIESVDERIKNAWRQRCKEFERVIENLKEIALHCGKEDESGDSDYEVEYISEEVKKDVEDAFRRKDENQHINRLTKKSTSLQKLQGISLVTGERTTDDKRGKYTQVLRIDCSNEVINEDTDSFRLSTEKKVIKIAEKFCDSKGITFQTVNAARTTDNITQNLLEHCKPGSNHAAVMIDPEKSDNTNQKSLKSDEPRYEDKKEILMHKNVDNRGEEKGDLVGRNDDNIAKIAKNIDSDIKERVHIKISKHDCGKIEKVTEIEVREKIRKSEQRNSENQAESMEIEMSTGFEEGNLEIDLIDCDNLNQSMEAKKPDEIEKKPIQPEAIASVNLHENINIQNIEENNISIEHIDHDYANQNLEFEESETIEVTKTQFNNSNGSKKKQCTETETPKYDVEGSWLQNSSDFKLKQSAQSERLEGGGMALRSENPGHNRENLCINTKQFDIREEKKRKSGNSENVTNITETKESDLIQNSNSKPVVQGSSYHGKRKFVQSVKPSEDIIVISSDSSDEERYKAFVKNGANKVNRKSSRILRSTKAKWFQARDAVAARIRQSWMENKKILKESTHNKNVRQVEAKNCSPEKYFQCTSCNINLYSVPAVLYHHNATHTSHEESLSCHMCEMAFPTRDDLFKHFDQHVESHLYRCLYCSGQFVLKKNLRSHTNCRVGRKLQEPEKKKPRIEDSNLKRNESDKIKQDVQDSEKENTILGKP